MNIMRQVLMMWKRIIIGNFRKTPWTIFLSFLPIFLMIILGMTTKNSFTGISSFQYYGVVQITFMALYNITTCVNYVKEDERIGALYRLRMAGISSLKYYIINLFGFLFLSALVTLPSFVVSIRFLGTKWGNVPAFSYICILSLSAVMISFGLLLTKIVNNVWSILDIINTIIIPFMSYLGGAFGPNSFDSSPALKLLSNMSLVKWLNEGIFSMVYRNDYSIIIISLIINLSLTFIFMMGLVIGREVENKLC